MRRTAPSNLKRAHLFGRILLGAVCATLLVQTAEADAGRRNAASSTLGQQKPPKITSLKPSSGVAGTTVTVSGSNFTGASAVAFNGTRAGYRVKSSNTIIAQVPAGAGSGPVTVTTSGGNAMSSYSFTVMGSSISPPTVTGFSPSTATPGTTVTLVGANFTGVSAVAFNGAAASFTVNSGGQITTTVPASATTGPITVTASGGTATTVASFTVNNFVPSTALFVAPTGSDATGDGSISKPFATLAKAQATMRLGGPQITYIRGGFYALPAVAQNNVTYGLYLTAAG